MAFLATNLVQNIYNELGQIDPHFGLFEATGGSATTFINTNFGNFENPPELDAFKNQLAIVVRDAGGASASPEGKWALCSAYADTSYTGTIATVTDAIASGDTIMLAKQDKFPLQTVLFAINRGLEELGDLPANANTSLTIAADTTEYSIPVAVKRGLKGIFVTDQNGDETELHDYRVEMTAANTAAILYIPQLNSGDILRLLYDGPHAVVSAYSDVINEYVHPKVAVAAAIVKLLQWYNRRDENQDAESYFLWLEGEYVNKHLPFALAQHPIPMTKRTPKYSTFRRTIYDRVPDPIT